MNIKLLLAAENGKAADVLASLQQGADIEARYSNGDTALLMASWRGHFDIARILVERGADIEKRNC